MIFDWNNPPDDGRTVKITEEELFESTDLWDEQKTRLSRILTFTELLGITVWFCPDTPCIFFEYGEDLSDIISIGSVDTGTNGIHISDMNTLNNVAFTLEFICKMQGLDSKKEDENAEHPNLFDLARRMTALEKTVELLQKRTSEQSEPSQEDALEDNAEEEMTTEFDALELEPRLKLFIDQLRARARFIGCDILWEDTLPENTRIKGDDPHKQFNCVYMRPTEVYVPTNNRMQKLSIGMAYRSGWPHWYKSADRMSGWLFHLPEDNMMLENFVRTDERTCGVKPKD